MADAGLGHVYSQAKLDAVYTATLLGLPIGHGTWTLEIADNRFSAAASGSAAGLMRLFANGHGTANAQGIVASQQPIASNFTLNLNAGHSSDQIKIVFAGGKARESVAQPPKPNPNLVPLTDAFRVGVVDPMTALLIRVPGSGATTVAAACKPKIPVFDGRMRYDLHLTFKRIETIKAGITGYQGPVVVCGLSFAPLAGYDPTRTAIKYLRAERNIEVWLAPVAGTRLLVPLRLSVPTPLGLGVLQATRFFATVQNRSTALNSN